MRYYRPPKPRPQQQAPSRMTYQEFMQSSTNGLTPDSSGKGAYGRPDSYRPPMADSADAYRSYQDYMRTGETPNPNERKQFDLGGVSGGGPIGWGAGVGGGSIGYSIGGGIGGGGGGEGGLAKLSKPGIGGDGAHWDYDMQAYMDAIRKWQATHPDHRGPRPKRGDFRSWRPPAQTMQYQLY